MPTPTSYTYDIAQDFPGGKVNIDKLKAEILAATGITIALDVGTGITQAGGTASEDGSVITGGTLTIPFRDDLGAQQDVLDGGAGEPHGTHPAGGLIAAHDNSPSISIVPVSLKDGATYIKQERKTVGHYNLRPLKIEGIAAGATKYKDVVVPDLTRGWDWLNVHFNANDADSGDMLVAGKLLGGQIGSVAAPASSGATTIMVASQPGVLVSTEKGGAIDEGFYLSFGVEASTADAINAIGGGPPGSGTLDNPEGELREYQIKRIGAETPIGGGLVMVAITLFTPLAADVAPGTNANLVVRGIPEPIEVTKGDNVNVGGDAFTSGNLPAGTRVRFGYKNTGNASKTVRGVWTVFYGGS